MLHIVRRLEARLEYGPAPYTCYARILTDPRCASDDREYLLLRSHLGSGPRCGEVSEGRFTTFVIAPRKVSQNRILQELKLCRAPWNLLILCVLRREIRLALSKLQDTQP